MERRHAPALRRFLGPLADAGQDFTIVDEQAFPSVVKYDAIPCLDVIEHVPDPPRFVGTLAKALRPGGRLMVNAPFFFARPMPTHLRSNRRYSGVLYSLYGRHGLHLETRRDWWTPLALRKDNASDERDGGTTWQRLQLRAAGLLLVVGRVW